MATNEIQKAKIAGIAELTEWGKFAVQSGVLPSGVSAWQAMAIIQTGSELGIPPMSSLTTLAFVKGRLSMATKLMLALAKERCSVEIFALKEEDGKCEATLKRGEQKITCVWTIEMAKKANLAAKDNWICYPAQMLRWRAVCDALRLIAPDAVLGLVSTEEAEDMDAPFAFDPSAEVKVTPEQVTLTVAGMPIEREQRVAIIQAMTVAGWIVNGQMTLDAVSKLGELGYENSAQIPKRDFERILKAFSEPAPVTAAV